MSSGAPQHPSSRFDSPGMRRAGLLLILFLFLLQAVPFLSNRWVTDESWYAGPAYSLSHGNGMRDPAIGPNDIENHFDARPPGTALTIASAFRLVGSGAWQARLGSLLAGLGSVWLLYGILRRRTGDAEAALFAALLLATDNLLVLCARTARPEALTVFFILLALFALERYAASGRLLWAAGAGLVMAIATMVHITVLGYIVAIGLLLLALDRLAHRFPLRGALVYSLAFFIGLIPFATWILTAPLGPRGFRQEFLGRAVQSSLSGRFLSEGHRYVDVLGLHLLHGHGLDALPLRLPIPLCFLLASAVLWRYRRRWFAVELTLLVPTLLWLAYTVNKSSRYVDLLAPIFAGTIGLAVATARRNRVLHRWAVALACLVAFAQFGANLVLLRAAAKANYTRVGAGLRALIPPDQTAYGSITFWLGFRGRPYISYERTEPWQAVRDYGVRYFILGDRVMLNGPVNSQAGDDDFYRQLNHDLNEVTAQSTIVGTVDDPYYGHLVVYHLNQPGPAR